MFIHPYLTYVKTPYKFIVYLDAHTLTPRKKNEKGGREKLGVSALFSLILLH